MNNSFDFIKPTDITTYLFSNRDDQYKEFSSKLIPDVEKERFIGVRTPILRKLSKHIYGTDSANAFLNQLPHRYVEENHLHAFLIENEKDFDTACKLTEDLLAYIDNWATCDCFRPKVFKKNLKALYEHIKVWIKSDHVYTKRYAIGLLLSFYLDDAFDKSYLQLVASIKSDEYYINMMIAWFFATAIAKQPEFAIPYIENKVLDKWTHNKTITKSCESYRVDDKTKNYLKTLRIK